MGAYPEVYIHIHTNKHVDMCKHMPVRAYGYARILTSEMSLAGDLRGQAEKGRMSERGRNGGIRMSVLQWCASHVSLTRTQTHV